MALKLITAPATSPLSLDEVKAHLRVDHEDENAFIETLISAVTKHLDARDGWLGRALTEQTWELWLDAFPASEIRIPLPPLQEIVSIKYDDVDGDEQTVDSDDYTVDTVNEPGWVVPNATFSWPDTLIGINTVRVRFICGYPDVGGSPLEVGTPAAILAAMKLMIGDLYAHRETVFAGVVVNRTDTVNMLLAPYEIHFVG